MLKRTILSSLILLIALFSGPNTLASGVSSERSVVTKDQVNQYELSDNEWIVRFQDGLSEARKGQLLMATGLVQSVTHLPSPDVSIVIVNRGIAESQIQSALESIGQLDYAGRGLIYRDGVKEFPLDRVFVQLRSSSQQSLLQQKASQFGATVIGESFMPNLYELAFTKNSSVDPITFSNQLNAEGQVDWSEPDMLKMLNKLSTNDTYIGSQWSLNNTASYFGGTAGEDMDVFNAWGISTGSSSIKVAILDEGVDLNHPDLAGNMLAGFDGHGITAGDAINDDAHGTACAAIVAAVGNNNLGTAGIAYSSKIVPVRIAYSQFDAGLGRDVWITSSSIIGNCITWAWQTAGADVLSNSWGGGANSSLVNTPINNAVSSGRGGLGAPVLFSAGNDNSSVNYPATQADVISVAAMSMCGERKSPSSCDGETWWGSNYGSGLDVSAPGVKVYAADIAGADGYSSGDYTGTFNGTSSACPNAAGVMALILSVDPTLTETQARDILESTCDKAGGYTYTAGSPNGTWSNELGYGRVNAYAAVQAAQPSSSCPAVSSFPFNEGFETTSATLACWTNEYVAGTSDWTFASGSSGGSITSAYSGTDNARFVSQSGSNSPATRLVSPVFDMSGLTNPRMLFYYGQQQWLGDQNELKVYYRTSSSGAWTQLAHYLNDVSSWTLEILTLPNPSATYQIAFEGINNYGYANVLDDITIEETPLCPTPVNFVSTGATDVSVDLAWDGGSATGWNVEYGTTGFAQGNGTVISSSGPTKTVTGLSASMTYDFYVQADCGSAWTGPVTVTTQPCASNATCTYTVNMIDDYGDGWNGALIDVIQGGVVVATFGANFTGGSSATATIDLCDGLNTQVVANAPGSYPSEVGFDIVDPFGATVLSIGVGNSFASGASFGSFTSGCTPPACPDPFNLGVLSATASSVTVYWNGGSASTWNVEIDTAGFTPGTGTTLTATDDTVTLSQLMDNTSYDIYVQADCGSAWAGPLTATTQCLSASLPYMEDFDNWAPSCWDLDDGSFVVGQDAGGDYMEGNYWSWPTGNIGKARSQAVNISVDAQLRYKWAHLYSTSYPLDQLVLLARETGTAIWDTVSNLQGPSFNSPNATNTSPPGNADFIEEIINLPSSYTGKVMEFQFDFISGYGPDVYVDDFLVQAVPSCPQPSGLGVFGIAAASASIYWDGNGVGTYNVEFGPTGFALGSGMGFMESNDTTILTGLTDNTAYDFYVQADCGSGASAWSGPYTFTTLCSSFSLPYSESYDTWPPSCWDINSGTQTPVGYGGDYMEGSFWSWSSGTATAISPVIDITSNVEVSFRWAHLYSASYPNDELVLYVKRTTTSIWDTLLVLNNSTFSSPGAQNTTPPADSLFVTEMMNLNQIYDGQSVQFRFDLNSGFGPDVFVDDFMVEEVGSPTPPPAACYGLDSIATLNARQGLFRAHFDTLNGQAFRLEYMPVGDSASMRSKTIARGNQGFQNFNVTPWFDQKVAVWISIDTTGNGDWASQNCGDTVFVPCKPQTLQMVEQRAAFCAGDSVLVRAGYAGGYGAPSILWSNGATTKRTYASQGETLSVTITDASGCVVTDSITASSLNTVGVPMNWTLTKNNATTFTGSWSAPSLPAGSNLIGYRMAYRLRNTQQWTNVSLTTDTFSTIDFTGSGLPSGNYEFVAFTRYNDGVSATNSIFTCREVKGYNGSGNKSGGGLAGTSDAAFSIYPNPTTDRVYVAAENGSEVTLMDLNGKIIGMQSVDQAEVSFDMSNLAQGVYMIRIKTQNEVINEQVVKN